MATSASASRTRFVDGRLASFLATPAGHQSPCTNCFAKSLTYNHRPLTVGDSRSPDLALLNVPRAEHQAHLSHPAVPTQDNRLSLVEPFAIGGPFHRRANHTISWRWFVRACIRLASFERNAPVQNRSIPGRLHNTLLGRYEASQPRPGRLGGMQSLHSSVRGCVFFPVRTPCVVGH
jgi:hypothetical protein